MSNKTLHGKLILPLKQKEIKYKFKCVPEVEFKLSAEMS